MITIDIYRDDGEVTRLQGESGIAVAMHPLPENLELAEPAGASLRCSTSAEMAWNLAVMIATVRDLDPRAYSMAKRLSHLVRPNTDTSRKLPRWERGSG